MHADEVSSRTIPTKIKELDVKQCYYKIVSDCPAVLEYLPDPYGAKQQLPDNNFFWTVLFSIARESTLQFIENVYIERRKKTEQLNKTVKL